MTPFIHYKENNRHFILQRAQPHYLGEILTYPDNKALYFAQLPGYQLFVTFKGTLSGHGLILHKSWKEDVTETVNKMMEWFLTTKVLVNEGKYKRFLIENYLTRTS